MTISQPSGEREEKCWSLPEEQRSTAAPLLAQRAENKTGLSGESHEDRDSTGRGSSQLQDVNLLRALAEQPQ